MRNNFIGTAITATLLVILIILALVTIQSLERVHFSNMKLIETLERIEANKGSASNRTTLIKTGDPAGGSLPANHQYFKPDAPVGGKIIQAIGAEPPNLNPIITNEATTAMFASLCTIALAERDMQNPEIFAPLLAESWEASPDFREFRIKLRKNVFFRGYTDPESGKKVPGAEVTAQDFKFFVDVVKNEKVNAAPLRVYYQDLDEVEIVNDHEFIVRWKKSNYGSLSATLNMSPLPRFFYWNYDGDFDPERFNNDHLRNNMIVGCGPYYLDSYVKGDKLIFRRNDEYFGNTLGVGAKIETLEYQVIKHPSTRFQALLAGKLDELGLTPDQWVRRANEQGFTSGKIKRYQYLVPQYTYIGYNQKNPLFQSKKVRQALTMLVDREKIRHEIYFDLAQIATGPFFPGSAYGDKSIKPYPYDPAAAAKLLKEENWVDVDGDGILEKDGKKFVFTILQVANNPLQQRVLPMIKESFAAAGIDIKIQTVEWSVYIQRLNERSYDVCMLGWVSNFDPDLYQVWHSSQIENGGSNHISYANATLDALIEKLQKTFDLDERLAISKEIAQLLHDEQPYTFLFCPYSLVAISDKYDNVRVFPSGIPEVLFSMKP